MTSDADLLSVVGYLYRNPLRAGLVGSVGELARWPWSGFSALTGARAPRPFEAVGATLALFGRDSDTARRNLLQHVSRAEPGEANPALLTQPLSQAPESEPNEPRRTRAVDCRGSVARLDDSADAHLRTLVEAVCREHGLDPSALGVRNRARAVSEVRAIISYRAVVELRIPGWAVAGVLGVSPSAVSHALERGRALSAEGPGKER